MFGRSLSDAIPMCIRRLKPSIEWLLSKEQREQALKDRQGRMKTKWAEHSRELEPLRKGDRVYVQNQTGVRHNKWDKTGVVQAVLGNRQYKVILDQTGRETVRNRRFLRPCVGMDGLGRNETGKKTEVADVGRPVRTRRRPVRFSPG